MTSVNNYSLISFYETISLNFSDNTSKRNKMPSYRYHRGNYKSQPVLNLLMVPLMSTTKKILILHQSKTKPLHRKNRSFLLHLNQKTYHFNLLKRIFSMEMTKKRNKSVKITRKDQSLMEIQSLNCRIK